MARVLSLKSPQETISDISAFFEARSRHKSAAAELLARKINGRLITKLTGITNFTVKFNDETPKINLTHMPTAELLGYAQQAKKDFDLIFLKWQSRRPQPKRGFCAECGKKIGKSLISKRNKTTRCSYCRDCWSKKFFEG